MATIKKENSKGWWDVEKFESLYIAGRNVKRYTPMEISMAVPQKLRVTI